MGTENNDANSCCELCSSSVLQFCQDSDGTNSTSEEIADSFFDDFYNVDFMDSLVSSVKKREGGANQDLKLDSDPFVRLLKNEVFRRCRNCFKALDINFYPTPLKKPPEVAFQYTSFQFRLNLCPFCQPDLNHIDNCFVVVSNAKGTNSVGTQVNEKDFLFSFVAKNLLCDRGVQCDIISEFSHEQNSIVQRTEHGRGTESGEDLDRCVDQLLEETDDMMEEETVESFQGGEEEASISVEGNSEYSDEPEEEERVLACFEGDVVEISDESSLESGEIKEYHYGIEEVESKEKHMIAEQNWKKVEEILTENRKPKKSSGDNLLKNLSEERNKEEATTAEEEVRRRPALHCEERKSISSVVKEEALKRSRQKLMAATETGKIKEKADFIKDVSLAIREEIRKIESGRNKENTDCRAFLLEERLSSSAPSTPVSEASDSSDDGIKILKKKNCDNLPTDFVLSTVASKRKFSLVDYATSPEKKRKKGSRRKCRAKASTVFPPFLPVRNSPRLRLQLN